MSRYLQIGAIKHVTNVHDQSGRSPQRDMMSIFIASFTLRVETIVSCGISRTYRLVLRQGIFISRQLLPSFFGSPRSGGSRGEGLSMSGAWPLWRPLVFLSALKLLLVPA